MKRYGFKFEKYDASGTKFIELRFSITIFSVFALVFAQVVSGRGEGGYYIGFWLLYMVLAFLPEIFEKIHVYLVVAISILSCVFALLILKPGNNEEIAERNIFIIYQICVLFIASLYLYAQYKRKKS